MILFACMRASQSLVFQRQCAEHLAHFQFMFFGIEGESLLVPWMWTSVILSVLSLILLINPKTRAKESLLAFACAAVFFALWIEKGLGMIIAGFVPSPLGKVVHYAPTGSEMMITLAIWAIGATIVTLLYKIALTVRGEIKGAKI